MQKNYVFLFLITSVVMSLPAADKSPSSHRRSPSLLRAVMQRSNSKSVVNVSDIMELHKKKDGSLCGYVAKERDDSNQSPFVYHLLKQDKKTIIARVHVHTISPKHLWIKDDLTVDKEEVTKLLALWKKSLDDAIASRKRVSKKKLDEISEDEMNEAISQAIEDFLR